MPTDMKMPMLLKSINNCSIPCPTGMRNSICKGRGRRDSISHQTQASLHPAAVVWTGHRHQISFSQELRTALSSPLLFCSLAHSAQVTEKQMKGRNTSRRGGIEVVGSASMWEPLAQKALKADRLHRGGEKSSYSHRSAGRLTSKKHQCFERNTETCGLIQH